jgi:hypothetical protein
MIGASCAPAEQRLDDCRADRHDEHRFDEKAEPGELHELAAGGQSWVMAHCIDVTVLAALHASALERATMLIEAEVTHFFFGQPSSWSPSISDRFFSYE